jgi:CcmD family protein
MNEEVLQMKRVFLFAMTAIGVGVPAWAQQPPSSQDGFVPVNSLPPVDTLPAAPMVMAAYAFVWVVLFVYVWSIWRRLQKVEHEIADLNRRAQSR